VTLPDWLQPTFSLLPALLAFYGAGLPWALALLPRREWRNLPLVAGVGMALGAVGVTTVLFGIGTVGRFSPAAALIAVGAVWALGLIAAIFARQRPPALNLPPRARLTPLEALLISLIAIGVGLRFWNTAYWPFTTYDALWVYGYNAKVFLLEGLIPARIGYYPQLIPLSYTYAQLIWGGIFDHAARTVLPYYALIGVLMAYALGRAFAGRRAGLIAAAVWTLYPHHAVWSQFGDLEVTVTAYFTGTAAFFLMAWRERQPRYYAISGLLLAGALWTKPTAGALIQSIGLIGVGVVVGGLVGVQGGRQVWGRLRGVILTLAAGFPIGGMWYIRNVLYGHPPLVLPPGYWQNEAQRSGQELGWLLVIGGLIVAALIAYRVGRLRPALTGLGLVLIGTLPSAFGYRLPTFGELSLMAVGQIAPTVRPTVLTVLEYALIGIGAALLVYGALPAWGKVPQPVRPLIWLLLAFTGPYFVTWFWSYSYHYRLSFAIVPLLITPISALTDALIRRGGLWLAGKRPGFRRLAASGGLIVVGALALPGLWGVLSALRPALYAELPDIPAKVRQGNAALMGLVDFLSERRAALGRPLRVIAPGELRLNFFFPQDDIQGDIYPLWLDDVAGVDYFIDSSVGQRLYTLRGERYNQILSSLTRDPVMWRAFTIDDKNFRFSAYEVNNANRFKKPEPNGKLNAQVGDFAFLHGHDLNTLSQVRGQPFHITLWWEALGPAQIDYSVFIHLWDAKTGKLAAAWGGQPVEGAWSVWYGVPGEHFDVPYPTRLWQKGEIVKDEWREPIPTDVPPGTYELRVGLYDPISGERLPITQDGQPIGDSILLNVVEVK